MRFTLPDEVIDILHKFQKANYEVYIAGGAVRDLLMGKPVVDWDFTTNATPEEIVKVLGKSAYYNNRFGTVGLPAQDKDLKPFEVTTYRHEIGYTDRRRPDKVVWGKSLQKDLARRDFTINAIALSPDHKLIDPFSGKDDLVKKLVRAVGDPQERFSEDALRMLRAIRIATQLGFKIEPKTKAAIKTNRALLEKIARERVRDELLKTLASPNPTKGVELLRETELLELIIPEAEKMFGVDQRSPQRHHIYDVGTHAIMSLKHCQSPDPIVRLATFIHDIGKPQTYKKLDTGVVTFYNHEVVGARIARTLSSRLRLSKAQSIKLYKLVRWHQFTVSEVQTDKAIRRFIKRVGNENIDDMLDLRRADRLGSGARETSWRTEEFKKRLVEVQKQPFSVHDLKVSGNDIMKALNLKPGPEVGKILNQLFKEVADHKLQNTKKALLQRSKNI